MTKSRNMVGVLFLISAVSGAYLLATDRSLWYLAASHAYGLAAMCAISVGMAVVSFTGNRRLYAFVPVWAVGVVILQLGDLATAPAYNMTIAYFASYLFGLPAYDVLLLTQFAVLAVYFITPRAKVQAKKGAYFEAAARGERRDFLRITGSIAVFFLLAVILSVIDLTGSQPSPTSGTTTQSTNSSASSSTNSTSSSSPSTTSTSAGGNPSGVIANVNNLQVGTPFTFDYPDSNHPNILLKLANGSLAAYSLLCTHVCCTVSYSTSSNNFYCPCHASLFDGGGNVVRGPAALPLPKVLLQVDSSGNVTATGFSGASPCIR